MTVMSTTAAPASWLPHGRPLTADDLEHAPEDGHRYELIDGVLIVTPGPTPPHQSVQLRLALLLHPLLPPDLRVLMAPLDVLLAPDTVVQPDILVARFADFGPKNLPAAPVLAVEVRLPSTALIDSNLKKARYERAGILSYWIVDPDPDDPVVTVFELSEDGRYVERASVRGGDSIALDRPFPVTLVPVDLVADLKPR